MQTELTCPRFNVCWKAIISPLSMGSYYITVDIMCFMYFCGVSQDSEKLSGKILNLEDSA